MTEPRREVGFWTATSLVIGSMIGSGVFLLPAALAAFGGISMLAWVITAAGSVMLALVFAHLSKRNPASGGVYAYTRDGFGDFAGFLVAWGYWISMWSANAALSVAFVGYAGPVISSISPSIPDIANTPVLAASMAIGTLWFLTFVNTLGVATAGKVQVVTTTLKLLPLVVVGIGGVFSFNSAHFAFPDLSASGDQTFGLLLLAAMTQTLFAFVGLEVATVPAGLVKDPDRTIPRATLVGTILTAAIYVISTAGAMSLVAPEVLMKSTAPFADAARVLGGNGLGTLVAVGAAISAFGSLNGWILVVSQLPLAVAKDGLFPRPFARLSSSGMPVTGMVIAGVLSSLLIMFNYSGGSGLVVVFTKTLVLSTLATLIPYAFCSLAVFIPGGGRAKNLGAGAATIAIVAFIYSLFCIYGAGQETVFLGFLLIVVGLPVYVWVVRHRVGAARPQTR
jgi:APA family basic amino acid/polyamine antiporter